MSFFFPKQPEFFKDLEDLTKYLQSIAKLFDDFTKDFSNFSEYSKKASVIEHQADEKTHNIISAVNSSFITPVDREDMYLLTHKLDDILDLIENAIHNVELYKVTKKFSGLEEFSPLILKAGDEISAMVIAMRKLKHTPEFIEIKIRIHNLEDEGDRVFASAISDLFARESNPIDVIKIKDILENLEHIMDKFQEVCDIIEGIVVKAG